MGWFTQQAPQQSQGALGQLGQGGLNTPQPVPGGVVKFPGVDQSTTPPIASAGRVVNGSEPIWPGGPTWDQLRQQNGGYLYDGGGVDMRGRPFDPSQISPIQMGDNSNGWPPPTNGGINPQGVPKLNPDGTYAMPPPQQITMGGGYNETGNRGSGQPINQAFGGSLASLGGVGMAPNMNQSGMVTLRSPDGRETQQVSANDAAHWLSRGAVRM